MTTRPKKRHIAEALTSAPSSAESRQRWKFSSSRHVATVAGDGMVAPPVGPGLREVPLSVGQETLEVVIIDDAGEEVARLAKGFSCLDAQNFGLLPL
eukprot:CAMPEP_0170586974 /NCGR_PEP_ID=MMETSP0224-20130122/10031_1 /TAXON_ID=285029 /ORGANISM="Togula jolla, Strain CCCM 725" /LENGTH=96 /DNA_ID=CAMNT_0010910557 /DNA_START=11 /DNA_END=303 /DNA_ORIENTATION=-